MVSTLHHMSILLFVLIAAGRLWKHIVVIVAVNLLPPIMLWFRTENAIAKSAILFGILRTI